jgi:predicted transcriptional regulator
MDEQPDKISDHQSRQYLLIRESVMKTYILRQYQSSEIEPMSKQAVFTMKLEPELRDEFMAEAEASHRPASQIVREMMRQFVQTQRESREYEEFLHRKVDVARASMRAGNGLSNNDVEAEFAARRTRAAIEE